MNKIKKNILDLLLILFVTTCQQAEVSAVSINTPMAQMTSTETATPAAALTAFPTSELAPYYGTPQPAKVIVNNKAYESEIGTTMWITEVKPDGSIVGEIGDAFAIITPTKSILITPNPSLILKLPISINPTELWHILYKVSEQELSSQDGTRGAFRWNPDYKTQAYIEQTDLPLLSEQPLTFSLQPGIYVYEVHSGWGGSSPHTELEADFGFLPEVQE